ncbi:MAG: hypothetical protein ACE5FJ_04240 [Gemmatimonadales bacterium]
MKARSLALTALTIIAAGGCGAGWRRVSSSYAEGAPPRQQVQVWHNRGMDRLHGVTVVNDTLSGVHFLQPLSCDSCRIQFPIEAIDSIRAGHPEAGFWKGTGLVFGVSAILAWIFCMNLPCSTT